MADTRNSSTPSVIFLKDYQAPQYLIESIDLCFDLQEENTRVISRMNIRANPAAPKDAAPLVLDGHDLTLLRLTLNGEAVAEDNYKIDDEQLILFDVPPQFELEVETRIQPQLNTSLEGLYKSSGNFCTQCEAQGFRRISYFPDRPDVLARYTVRIEADRAKYPVLLSNGNRMAAGELGADRHWVQWQDPFPKPSYLFALVAGNLGCVSDTFTTRSGRQVSLQIYVQQHNLDKCEHALRSLKKAMQWDEEVYGREYDLDLFMIVAVDDFNMGAMENKGLNIFNSSCVLAKPDTATDADYQNIERIVAHEYFHNWSGNRVTCRDWFQLSLKEGFTVFRDQEFSADMTSRPVKRINDVNILRTHQFREDAGPMAHPVRPDSYVEINNFYTLTVYNKGAEVVRMIRNLVGAEGFRKGSDLYFERHDGQAVTTDDFVAAMENANNVDLTLFRNWYSQAGTPHLTVNGTYNEQNRTFIMDVRQDCPATRDQNDKAPFHIPLAVALLDDEGREMPLQLDGEVQEGTRVLELTQSQHRFEFTNIPRQPVMSLLRDFSAPVKLTSNLSGQERIFLMSRDGNAFNRWDIGQRLLVTEILRIVNALDSDAALKADVDILDALAHTLNDKDLDHALIAQALSLPAEAYVSEFMDIIRPVDIHRACRFLRREIAVHLRHDLLRIYQEFAGPVSYEIDARSMGQRSLKNVCLGYLMESADEDIIELCRRQYDQANNMTDRLAALVYLVNCEQFDSGEMLEEFHRHWQHDQQVVEKWLGIQAACRLPDTLNRVKALLEHPAFNFTNPNKVRALIGGFAGNAVNFHQESGEGYGFVAENILRLNDLNPMIAARLCNVFTQWRRFDTHRQSLMQKNLQRIAAHPALSRDVYEIVSRCLQ